MGEVVHRSRLYVFNGFCRLVGLSLRERVVHCVSLSISLFLVVPFGTHCMYSVYFGVLFLWRLFIKSCDLLKKIDFDSSGFI